MITKNTNLQVDMAILYKIKAYKKILVIYLFKICTQLGVDGLCNANKQKLSIDSIIQMVNVYYNEPGNDFNYSTTHSTPITGNNRMTPVSDSNKHFEVEMQQWIKTNSKLL